ncbi:hypothetical protein [Streptomyces somaliensis]|uniref:hypothetical protein n=1 Tax=Streptomyces somaliensis TaxID=78355 RepID=UPI0034E960BE|nr:hypothetical protein [Streptomyces somaliensis]
MAATTTGKVTPGLRVDPFRHAFVLRTKPCADFCDALGGEFIHSGPRPSPKRFGSTRLSGTALDSW